MDLTFAQVAGFVSKWRKLKLTDDDLVALEQMIMKNPETGDVMKGTGGIRKVRFAPPSWNTGKSGATRVCYIALMECEHCYLMSIFAKNEKANLTPAERNVLRTIVDRIKVYHRN